jgi:hypothetical protein
MFLIGNRAALLLGGALAVDAAANPTTRRRRNEIVHSLGECMNHLILHKHSCQVEAFSTTVATWALVCASERSLTAVEQLASIGSSFPATA